MKKEEKFMISEIMEDLEKEGLPFEEKDQRIYKQILSSSENWEVSSNKSDNDVWNGIQAKIGSEHQAKQIQFRPWLKWAASIALVCVAAIAVWWSNYERPFEYTASEFSVISLPDGSEVSLDVGATVTFKEARSGKRNVTLEGLAYFDVVEGKPFSVKTRNGLVEVLGTSFNVNTFDEEMRVECLTGKVMVEANSSVAVLTPGSMIKTVEGQLGVIEAFNVNDGMLWMDGEFHYQNALLTEVFTEVERQFGVSIDLQTNQANRTYSGLFSKEDDIEDVLNAIVLPMSLKYKKLSTSTYQVID